MSINVYAVEKKLRNNYAFIDAQNLYKAVRAQNWKLDYTRFRRYLTVKCGVTRAFLFMGYIPENQPLYEALRRQGYEIIFKTVHNLRSGDVKANVDAELILHAMLEITNYEKAVIVSGDGDFSCLVEYLKEEDKLEKLIIPDKNRFSKLLKKFLEKDFIYLNELRDVLKR